jgi:stringent starvation protein B
VYERVLIAPSELLQDVRNRDAWNMTHYMYGNLDKSTNRVRIPIDKAMQTFAAEAAAGKLFYPAKATPIKKEEPAAAAAAPAGAVPAGTTPAAAPAAAEPAKK